jgi:hypothetical protein
MFFKILQPPFRECALPVIFISSYINLAFSIITGPVTGFPMEHTAVNHLYNTLSSCAYLGSFNVYHLKMLFTLSIDAIKIVTGTYT